MLGKMGNGMIKDFKHKFNVFKKIDKNKKKERKIIKDVLYNFIEIEDLFLEVVSSEDFQRLRYIKQNGLSYLIYPNAIHSRFVHSLGVYHLTSIASRQIELRKNEDELKLAALLHDIGHGPFSHLSERALSKVEKVNHEEIGIEIIKEKYENLFDEYGIKSKKVIKFIKGEREGVIITGDVGTDRLDYLKRDSYFSGLNFGKIDSERIIRFMEYRRNKLYLDDRTIFDVYHLILARFLMFKSFYIHKVSELATKMLEEALILMTEEYSIKDLMRMVDNELIFKALNSNNERIREIFKMIYFRKLPKSRLLINKEYLSELGIKELSDKDINLIEEELRSYYKNKNIWVFKIGKVFKQASLEFRSGKKIRSYDIIKSLEDFDEDLTKIYIFSDKRLNKIDLKVKELLKKI